MRVDHYPELGPALTAALQGETDVHFILDDEGAVSWNENPVELIETYYSVLDPQGRAWIKIPKTIWIMQKTNRRILLSEYLLAKFPMVFRTLLLHEITAPLDTEVSSPKEMIEMLRDRSISKLKIGLKVRSSARTLKNENQPSKPVLEYGENSS